MKYLMILLLLPGLAFANANNPRDVAGFFNKMTKDNVAEVCAEFYAEDVKFVDPLGSVQGRQELVAYYQHMYENVISIHFEDQGVFEKGDESVFIWNMRLKHSAIDADEPIEVSGTSVMRFKDGKVIYHRDYFDVGAMLYEHIPVIGSLIKWIKKKAHG